MVAAPSRRSRIGALVPGTWPHPSSPPSPTTPPSPTAPPRHPPPTTTVPPDHPRHAPHPPHTPTAPTHQPADPNAHKRSDNLQHIRPATRAKLHPWRNPPTKDLQPQATNRLWPCESAGREGCSPRPWGWSAASRMLCTGSVVLPTPVGVVPDCRPLDAGHGECSPRPWGWSHHAQPGADRTAVLPTPVGVVRCTSTY